jgi:flagellar L-ring protein precursor FlgH
MFNRDGHVVMLRVCALVLAGGLCALADPPAATDSGTPAPSAPPAANGPAFQQTPKGVSLPLGMVMEQNGGSLLRAEIEYKASLPAEPGAKPDAPPGSVTAINFFAVADPKPKAFKKHDLVSIIAKEQSGFTANGTSTLTKTQDIDDQLNSFIALRPSKFQLNSIISGGSNFPQIQMQNARDYKGTGDVERTDTFSDRVTAEVVDIKPNGTLVLQAIKDIRTDEEEQRMILTGICRAEDVTADNTVLTTQLFDLELTQTHTGAVNDTTKRGLLPRLLDTFSPF